MAQRFIRVVVLLVETTDKRGIVFQSEVAKAESHIAVHEPFGMQVSGGHAAYAETDAFQRIVTDRIKHGTKIEFAFATVGIGGHITRGDDFNGTDGGIETWNAPQFGQKAVNDGFLAAQRFGAHGVPSLTLVFSGTVGHHLVASHRIKKRVRRQSTKFVVILVKAISSVDLPHILENVKPHVGVGFLARPEAIRQLDK